MASINLKAIRSTLIGALVMAALVFIPAGTFAYWRGWLFLIVFEAASIAIGIYLAINDPALLARRMRVGPTAETEPAQKIIVTLTLIATLAVVVVSALDHRFGWSSVPPIVSVAANGLIVLSFVGFYRVLRENTYSASTVRVMEGQTVISTGPYALVRHPMYAAALLMLLAIPPALGSWWGIAAILLVLPVLSWRLLDEERLLTKDLPGYRDYLQKVPYRLVPYVW
jgi:protein-S-isoprenylcysteine O-methyltransferase Ste14